MSKTNSSEDRILLIGTPFMELVDYPTITNKRKGFYELTIANNVRIKGAGSKELIRNLNDIYFTIESIDAFKLPSIACTLVGDLFELMKGCASKDHEPDCTVVSDSIGLFGYNFCEPVVNEDGKDSCSVKLTIWLGNPDSNKYVAYTVRMKWVGIAYNTICAAVNSALNLIQSFFVDTRSIVRSVKRSVEVYFVQPPTPPFGITIGGDQKPRGVDDDD